MEEMSIASLQMLALCSALQRAIIELEYAQERLGQDRVVTRMAVIDGAVRVVRQYQAWKGE